MNQYQLQQFLTSGLKIGRIWGIEVRLHFLMILMIVLSPIVFGAGVVNSLILSVVIFGTVLLHELGHCYGARLVGGQADKIILWPLGGLAMVYGVDRNPKLEFIVTILGPLVNVVLAIISGVIFIVLLYIPGAAFVSNLVFWFLMINVIQGGFNLLVPLFPMDCARVVRSIFSFYYHPNRVTYHLCTGGMYLGGVMGVLGLLMNQSGFLLIGIFGAMMSYQERERSKVMSIYQEESYFYSYDNEGFFGWSWKSIKRYFKIPSFKRKKAKIVDVKVEPHAKKKSSDPLVQLQDEMSEAVEREDFQAAAEIRDKIKNLQNH